MYDELSDELRNLEARIRELRELLAAHRNYRIIPDEMAYQTASLLLTARTANEESDALLRSLRTAAQGAVPDCPWQADAAQADLYRALGIESPHVPRGETIRTDEDRPGPRDLPKPRSPGDDGPGGALVIAGPRLPIHPRMPGAARTFEEALEPPRDP